MKTRIIVTVTSDLPSLPCYVCIGLVATLHPVNIECIDVHWHEH